MQRYTTTAIALHWLMAVMLIANFALGLYMVDIPGLTPAKLRYFSWHKWAGVTILLVATVRLLWRLTHRPPAALPMPAWQRRAAHGAHLALYMLFFVMAVVGLVRWRSAAAEVIA